MKKKLLLVYVFVAFVLLCTNVYAVITMDMGLAADKTSVKPGEDVVVTVSLKNISNPISSIEGYVNVDENVLKEISKDSVVTTDNKIEVKSGSTVSNKLSYVFNPTSSNADYDVIFNTKKENIENNDCFFVMDFDKDIESSAEILKLKFEVKDGAEIKNVKEAVKVDCIVAYSADSSDKTEPMSASLDINVVKANEPSDDDNKPDDNKPDDNKPDDNKPDDNKPDDNKPDDNKPDDNKPDDNKPDDNKPDDNKPDDNKPSDNKKNENTNTNQNTNKAGVANTAKNTPNNNTNTNKDGTVAGTKIPAAGAGLIIVPILLFAVLAYISYDKYIKYKDI